MRFYTCSVASKQRKRKLQRAMASRIKALRQDAGLTQEQLSERAGIATQYLSRLENAHQVPSLNTMIDLADALGTVPCVLLDEPQEDMHAEFVSRVAAMCRTLTKEDAAFLESQLAGWMAYMKKRRDPD